MSAAAPEIVPGIYFELTMPGISIGYFTEVSGLNAEVEVFTYNEGGNNSFVHKLPTRVKYPSLVLKRGISSEAALETWFAKSVGPNPQRVDVTISMLDEEQNRLRTWAFANAYPVKWTGPQFNVGQSAVATEALEIAHDGIKAP
jgi:phage tail-like protein